MSVGSILRGVPTLAVAGLVWMASESIVAAQQFAAPEGAADPALPDPPPAPVRSLPAAAEEAASTSAADDLPAATESRPPQTAMPVIRARKVDPRDYREIYDAIPFSRTEYEANPSYRHEATMEILFGEMRPTTIHRYQPAPTPQAGAGPWWTRPGASWTPYGSSRVRLGIFYGPHYPTYLRRWY